MASRPPRQTPQPNLSADELAWIGSVAERYDALVFHWVGPLTGSYFFLMPRSLWQRGSAPKRPRPRRPRRPQTA
jgi:hypothetical protein